MISIIVPAWNEEEHITSCLHALRQQTYKGKNEIIVVDDGSTDNTAAIVKKIKGIRLIQQKNAGPAAARNAGAKAARGDILIFTDADCEPTPDFISQMAATFADQNVWGVQGAYQSRQTELIARFTQLEIEGRYDRMRRFLSIDFIGTYAAGYRKKIFDQYGGFDASFPHPSGEDSEFSFRLAKDGGKLLFNPQAIVYHNHPTTLREYLRTKFYRAYWRVLLYRKHADKVVRETYTPQGLKLQIGFFLLFIVALGYTAITGIPWPALASYGLFVAAGIPTVFTMIRRDLSVGLAALGILQLRSIVFFLGLTEGVIAQRRST